jgi:hypothetical protein
MNRINNLLQPDFVLDIIRKRVLPHYPDFKDAKKVRIIPYKKNIWETTYHVVLEFETTFITREGKKKKLPIFCSAHSCEPRRNVYTALRYLWNHGFGHGYLSIPHALFYSEYYKATFYRGVKGYNLYHYIRKNDRAKIESILPKAAAWFAKLHRLAPSDAKNFNKRNSRIKTVLPGTEHIISRISLEHPEYADFYRQAYRSFVGKGKLLFGPDLQALYRPWRRPSRECDQDER